MSEQLDEHATLAVESSRRPPDSVDGPAVHSVASGVGWGLLAAAALGSVAIVAKLAYRDHLTVSTILAVRLSLGAVAVWLLATATGAVKPLPERAGWWLLALGGTCFYGQGLLVFESVQRISPTTMEYLIYTYPMMVAIAAVLFIHESMGVVKLGALAISLCGVGLLLGGPEGGVQSVGGAMALGAAVVTAVYLLLLRGATEGVHPLHASAIVLTGSACVAWAVGIATGSLHMPETGGGFGWLLLHGLLISVAASCSVIALQRMGPTRTAVTSTFEPVVTTFLAVVALGATVAVSEIFGGLLVILAAVILATKGSSTASPLKEPE